MCYCLTCRGYCGQTVWPLPVAQTLDFTVGSHQVKVENQVGRAGTKAFSLFFFEIIRKCHAAGSNSWGCWSPPSHFPTVEKTWWENTVKGLWKKSGHVKGWNRHNLLLSAVFTCSAPCGFTPAPDSLCEVSPIINASNVSSKDYLGTAADGDCSQTLSDRFPPVAIMGDVLSSCCRTMQGFMLFTLMQQLPLLPHPGLYTYVTHTALRAQHKLPAQALKVWKKQWKWSHTADPEKLVRWT